MPLLRPRLSSYLCAFSRCATTWTATPSSLSSLNASIDRMRNIGIVAHIDAGKTTTTERMLFYAGAVSRIGDVDSGTATTDFMKEETDRGITIQSAAVSFRWNAHDVHLIDTPGHADFIVEVERAMRVVDGVIALFDAAVGVQAQSYAVLQQSRRFGVPALALINKMDKLNANVPLAVSSIREKLSLEPLLLQLPLTTADGTFDGVIDLVEMTALRFRGRNGNVTERQPAEKEPPPVFAAARAARHALFSALSAADDALAEKLIAALDDAAVGGDEALAEKLIAPEELRAAIRRQTLRQHGKAEGGGKGGAMGEHGANISANISANTNADTSADISADTSADTNRVGFIPVLFAAARRDQGVQPLLDAVAHYLPSPRDRTVQWQCEKDNRVAKVPPARATPDAPIVALAFKVTHAIGPKGRRQALVFLRMYSGRLTPRTTLRNNNNGRHECVERLFVMRADERVEVPHLIAGEIGAAFLQHTRTGDTLFHPPAPLHRRHRTERERERDKEGERERERDKEGEREREEEEGGGPEWTLEGICAPPPVLSFAVEAATKSQIALLDDALRELTFEDPSLTARRNDFGQTVLSGMGELHLDIVLSRLAREYQLRCRLLRAVIEYRETITQSAEVNGAVGTHNDAPFVEVSMKIETQIDSDGAAAAADFCACEIDESFAAAYVSGEPQAPKKKKERETQGESETQEESETQRERETQEESETQRERETQSRPRRRAEDERAAREELRVIAAVFNRAVSDCARLGPLAGLPLHAARVTVTALRKLSGTQLSEKTLAPAAQALVLRLMRQLPRTARAALEPMMEVEVHVSDAGFIGNVITSLNERNAICVDLLEDGKSVRAVVPMRNIVRYTMELRKAVKGHANFFTRLHHYRVVEDKMVLARILKNLGIYEDH